MTENSAPRSSTLRPGDLFASKYRVIGELGQGGFGEVHLVENELGRRLALKVLHAHVGTTAQYRERFLREMDLAYTLQHENGVPIRDAGVGDGGRLYYTMDFIAGRTLRDVLKEERRLAPERIVKLGCQVASFLEYLHRKGIVHRDLKPDNLMVVDGPNGERVRVLDLGIAKAIEADDTAALSQGIILGTPSYMAPEHHAGLEIDARIDIYALGVILYELACGDRPFVANTVSALRQKILNDPIPPIRSLAPDFPSKLATVIGKALERDRNARYSSAEQFRRALLGADDELTATQRLDPPQRRARGLRLGIAIAAITAVGGIWLWVAAPWEWSDDRTQPRDDVEPPPVDRRSPRIVSIAPPAGARVAGGSVEVLVTADEELGAETRIGDLATSVSGREARAQVELAGGQSASLDIMLVDRADNESEALPYSLTGTLPLALEIVSPRDGELVGAEFQLEVRVSAEPPYELRLDGTSLGSRSGAGVVQAIRPEKDGAGRLTIEVVGADGRSVERILDYVCDRTGPRVLSISPEPSTFTLDDSVPLRIEVDEALGKDTRIDERPMDAPGAPLLVATLRFGAQDEIAPVIELADERGNVTSITDYRVRRARVPVGTTRLAESRPDPWNQGWATPVLEKRTGIVLSLVPPTSDAGFLMGAVPVDSLERPWERPRVPVRISKPFYLGRTEVTWGQWSFAKRIDGRIEAIATPSWFGDIEPGDDHPIVNVTWEQALEFCELFGFRLPREAEWEWACRLDAPDALYLWGDDLAEAGRWANANQQTLRDTFARTAPVASFDPTPGTGLRDLSGNAIEWCVDSFSEDVLSRLQARAPAVDPDWVDPQSHEFHVGRGGSFKNDPRDPHFLRISRRFRLRDASDDVGFRVAFDPREP